jgi:hypothetical protein
MSIEIVFETHALNEDNERGIATGWLPGRLCECGRAYAADTGRRRRDDGIAAEAERPQRGCTRLRVGGCVANCVPVVTYGRYRTGHEASFGCR